MEMSMKHGCCPNNCSVERDALPCVRLEEIKPYFGNRTVQLVELMKFTG